MKISELPEPLKSLAEKRREERDIKVFPELSDMLGLAFEWFDTEEGLYFWIDVDSEVDVSNHPKYPKQKCFIGPPPIDEDNNEDQKWEPKYGEIVWVWDNDYTRKSKMVFLAKTPKGYVCQVPKNYFLNADCNITKYKNISKYTPKEYTIQEVAKALGEEVGNFTIKSE